MPAKPCLRLCLLAIVYLFSCTTTPAERQMKIHGNIRNFPFKKVYLTDAHYWQKLLDSATVENGVFDFVLDTSVFKNPFQASIYYFDQTDKQHSLHLINYRRTTAKDTFGNGSFMLSYDSLEISGDFNSRFQRLHIKPTPENDLFFEEKAIKVVLSKNAQSVDELIKDHPSSYYLLSEINNWKSFYSPKELTRFISLFNNKVAASPMAKLITDFAGNIPEDGQLPAEIIFENAQQQPVNLFENNSSPLKMIIFWASWCGPCRQEIPQLKEIYRNADPSKLTMINVSIDEDPAAWKTAMQEEKMPWGQLRVPAASLAKTRAQFGFTSIPHIVFTNKNNKIVKVFRGFYADNIEKYTAFIQSYQAAKQPF